MKQITYQNVHSIFFIKRPFFFLLNTQILKMSMDVLFYFTSQFNFKRVFLFNFHFFYIFVKKLFVNILLIIYYNKITIFFLFWIWFYSQISDFFLFQFHENRLQ